MSELAHMFIDPRLQVPALCSRAKGRTLTMQITMSLQQSNLFNLSINTMAQSKVKSLFRQKSPEMPPRKDVRPMSSGEVWDVRTMRTSDGKRTRPPSPGQTKRNIRFARLPPMQKGEDGKWQPPSLSKGSMSTSALAAYAATPPIPPLSEAHYNIRLCTSFIVKCLTPVGRGSGFLAGHVEMRKIAEERLVLLERMERNWGSEWSAMADADRIKSARVGERQKERERRTMADALRDGVLLCL